MTPESDPIIRKYWLQSLARELLESERVVYCLRRRAKEHKDVEIRHSAEAGRAWYGNLQTCGSVWHCAICAAKITEQRRVELTVGIAESPYFAVLVTYTMQHSTGYGLNYLANALKTAHKRIKSGRAYQWLKAEYDVVGSFVSTEVTYGTNGWHPHMHEMLVLRNDLDRVSTSGLSSHLKRTWMAALESGGGYASFTHGVDVTHQRDYEAATKKQAGEYVTKSPWTIENELTKGNVKRGRLAGRSPVQLLIDYGNGDKPSGKLWIEYAVVMKGKRYLMASKGIKALLGIGSESDKDIADEDAKQDEYQILASINAWEWRVICAKEKRGELIKLAQSRDANLIRSFIDELTGKSQAV